MAATLQTSVSGAAVMVHLPSWRSKNANGLRPVIACHGHGGTDLQAAQGSSFAGHLEYLANHGHAVGMISTGDQWLSAAAMTSITNLYNYLITTLGAVGPKVALVGWSMGGGHALRWMLENPTLVGAAYLCSPLTDMDWAHASNTGYAAELDSVYANNFTANGSPRSPIKSPTAYRGRAPVLIAHATNDSTVPYSQTQAFISAVNDPAVTLRQPDILGDHQGGLTQVPPRESWEFLRTKWAA